MTPERRAEVVAGLRWHHKFYPASSLGEACRDAADALEAKPSESSMVQRIEALEKALRRIISLTAHNPKTTRPDAFANLNRIAGTAQSALDGPPDPERDREQPGEAERP